MRSTSAILKFGSLALLLAAAGCAGASSGSSSAANLPLAASRQADSAFPPSSNITGTYSGTLQDSQSGLQAVAIGVVQYVNSLSGTGEIVASFGASGVTVSGTVTGRTATGTITVAATGCVYGIDLAIKGKKLVGTYSPTSGGCTNSGTIDVVLAPSNPNITGKYSGSLVDVTHDQTEKIKMSLTQSASGVSGTFTTKPAGSGTISGTLSNQIVQGTVNVENSTCNPYNFIAVAYTKAFYVYFASLVCTDTGYITVKG